ncbi:outer-membrane lipoprotein carrier protein LolA [Microvirga aerilata]|uniref:Outer-membrane lipoprotein carrier protein LolA n=1 Tax=Microvirga aerilata TaxID=670292 RepID=A0A937CY15_9HYPH|nr:outer-membrane lipoprotein carrier protein LolA [Microvirga aerilata]MBL0402826.1 outer-membrane lipoprotein carrier protein LolA [Microvirga aerilata]
MSNSSLRCILGLALALASVSPAAAQQPSDPLTRFLDGVFKKGSAPAAPAESAPQATPAQPASRPRPQAQPQAQPQAGANPQAKPSAAAQKPQAPQKPRVTQPQPKTQPEPQTTAKPEPKPEPRPAAVPEKAEAKAPAPEPQKPVSQPPAKASEQAKPAEASPAKVAEPPKPARATPAQGAPAPTSFAAPATAPTPTSPPGPRSPEEALDRVNAYFNSIDQLSAYFVQRNPNGQQAEGSLSMRRPGQFHFAYSPPSTLEVVSDGRNVAIRDKKLGTNDVYPVAQTPLKFLVQENIDLSRDTKVRDVQVGRDGVVTVRFDDSATLGGTSKITLRFDSRANALRQWTIIDAQGYETTVTLSGLNATYRRDARASQ